MSINNLIQTQTSKTNNAIPAQRLILDAKFSCLPVVRYSSRIAEYMLANRSFINLLFIWCSAPQIFLYSDTIFGGPVHHAVNKITTV